MKQKKQMNVSKAADKKPASARMELHAIGKLKRSLGILVAFFSFLLYAQSISFDYVLDDAGLVKENKLVNKGIAGIPELVKTDYWYGSSGNIRDRLYRPASLVMFAIEDSLFHLHPKVNHFIN